MFRLSARLTETSNAAQESIMSKFFAALAVLTVVFGAALSSVPANASAVYDANHYEGGANN
jgi:hypothetical protein